VERILVTAFVREEIAQHLVSTYPHEGCGALVGSVVNGTTRISSVVPMKNIELARGNDRFVLDPAAYAALENKLSVQDDGTRIIGFFHSHPDGLSRPSSVDLEMARGVFEFARMFYVYAIQPTTRNGAGELTFWRLKADLSGFISVPAEAAPDE
jgi:proteasome lid subunit RPN8/RPN11